MDAQFTIHNSGTDNQGTEMSYMCYIVFVVISQFPKSQDLIDYDSLRVDGYKNRILLYTRVRVIFLDRDILGQTTEKSRWDSSGNVSAFNPRLSQQCIKGQRVSFSQF